MHEHCRCCLSSLKKSLESDVPVIFMTMLRVTHFQGVLARLESAEGASEGDIAGCPCRTVNTPRRGMFPYTNEDIFGRANSSRICTGNAVAVLAMWSAVDSPAKSQRVESVAGISSPGGNGAVSPYLAARFSLSMYQGLLAVVNKTEPFVNVISLSGADSSQLKSHRKSSS